MQLTLLTPLTMRSIMVLYYGIQSQCGIVYFNTKVFEEQ